MDAIATTVTAVVMRMAQTRFTEGATIIGWCRHQCGRVSRSELANRVAGADAPGLDNAGVHAAKTQRTAARRVDESNRIRAEPAAELRASGVRLVGNLDHRRTEREPCACGQILD